MRRGGCRQNPPFIFLTLKPPKLERVENGTVIPRGRREKYIYIYIYNWNKGDARREGSVYLRGEFLLTAGVDERTSERTNVSFIIIVSVKRLKEIEVRAHARTRGEIVGKSLSQIVAGLHR